MASFHIKRSTLYKYLGALKKKLGAELPGRAVRAHRTKDVEPPTPARRIEQDVASGVRCRRCHLLRPCDHG